MTIDEIIKKEDYKKIVTKYSQLKEFIRAIDRNDTIKLRDFANPELLVDGQKWKYPYKPFFILSLIVNKKLCSYNNLFNHKIKLDEDICKTYYDYLTENYVLYETLLSQKSKKGWQIGWKNNNKLYKKVLANMTSNPAKHLECNIFKYTKEIVENNRNNTIHWVELVLDYKQEDLNNIVKLLIEVCAETIRKCVPDYRQYGDVEILQGIKYHLKSEILVHGHESDNEVKKRQYQHIFAKEVKDNNPKCTICCTYIPEILEACHIKWFKDCDYSEAYDPKNGVTLCRNHHKLFDSGFFTFHTNGKVLIWDKKEIEDYDLLFRQYESCFLKTGLVFNSKYLEYHHNQVYKGDYSNCNNKMIAEDI